MNTKRSWLLDLFSNLQADLDPFQSESTSRGFAAKRFIDRMRKRADLGNNRKLDIEARKAFIETNQRVATEVALTADEIHHAQNYLRNLLWLRCVRETGIPQSSITDDDILEGWRFGPGASLGTQGTHVADKILSGKWTCTRAAEPYVVRLMRMNPYISSYHGVNKDMTRLVEGSKLGTVPKNEDTRRTTCTEPLGNMALQLSVGRVLESALSIAGFDIRAQEPKNKVLAWMGSISGDLATIDLSKASDMISPFLVRALLPEDLYDFLVCIRSPKIQVSNGAYIQANMISTMGNGFTFPLMTLIMLSLIYANRVINHGSVPNHYLDPEFTGVFGDDIIVPTGEYETTCDILTRAGLVVNHDKSYSSGPFRESCGGDYWNGYDVTPPYIESLKTQSDVYNAVNKVIDWCARHNFYLHRTMKQFKTLIGQMSKVHIVPEWLGPESGLITRDCPRQYEYLRVKPYTKTLRDEHFLCTLACGGYVFSFLLKGKRGKPSRYVARYTPRVSDAKFESRKGKLPSGYLHGWDPLCKEASVSLAVSQLIEMLL